MPTEDVSRSGPPHSPPCADPQGAEDVFGGTVFDDAAGGALLGEEERALLRDAGRLLHVVGDDHDGHLAREFVEVCSTTVISCLALCAGPGAGHDRGGGEVDRDPEPRDRSVGAQCPQHLRRADHENGPAQPGDRGLNPGSIDFIGLPQ
jgi:hypothetical protein